MGTPSNLGWTPLWEANGAAYFNKFNLGADLPTTTSGGTPSTTTTTAKSILKRLPTTA